MVQWGRPFPDSSYRLVLPYFLRVTIHRYRWSVCSGISGHHAAEYASGMDGLSQTGREVPCPLRQRINF